MLLCVALAVEAMTKLRHEEREAERERKRQRDREDKTKVAHFMKARSNNTSYRVMGVF